MSDLICNLIIVFAVFIGGSGFIVLTYFSLNKIREYFDRREDDWRSKHGGWSW